MIRMSLFLPLIKMKITPCVALDKLRKSGITFFWDDRYLIGCNQVNTMSAKKKQQSTL